MSIKTREMGALAMAGGLLVFAWAGPAAAQVVADDVQCLGCVDSNDLANGSVGSRKLANDSIGDRKLKDNTVGQKKLKDNAVTSRKILDGAVGQRKIGVNAITTPKIIDGAVTTDKLRDDAVTGDKIAPGAVSADNLAVDAVFGRILVVRNFPTDQVGNCDELRAVLADITDNDVNNRYLILLEPGIYDCGTTSVEMKPFVDIAGSGRETTLITGSRAGTNSGGVIRNARNTELRDLSVRNVNERVALYVGQPDSRVTNVRAEVTGTNTVGYALLVLNFSGTTVITNVEANTTDGASSFAAGLYIAGGPNAVLVNVVATAGPASTNSSGIQLFNATVTARNSVFSGVDGGAIALAGGGAVTANLVTSQLSGLVPVGGPATFRCSGSYDENFNTLDDNCDPIP